MRLQDDNIAELDEAFTIRFNIQNEQDLPISPKVINDTVLVTVTDEDSKLISSRCHLIKF